MYALLMALLGVIQAPVQGEPTLTLNGISVSDVDVGDGEMKLSLSVTKGTLSVANNEGLEFLAGDGSADPSIICTGKLDAINAALLTIDYFANENVTGTDTFRIVIDDQGYTGSGGAKSDTESITLTLPSINLTPVITVPVKQVMPEDAMKIIYGVKVEDGDLGNNDIKVTLSVGHGVVTLQRSTGLEFETGTGTSDRLVVFTGKSYDVNRALSALKYEPDQDYNGVDAITVTANDQGFTGDGGPKESSKAVEIQIDPVNDAPVINKPEGL